MSTEENFTASFCKFWPTFADNDWALSSQLQCAGLQALGCLCTDAATNLCAASERNLGAATTTTMTAIQPATAATAVISTLSIR